MMKMNKIGRFAMGAVVAFGMNATGAFAEDAISASHLKAARDAMTAIKITDSFDEILPNISLQLKNNLIQGNPNYEQIITESVDEQALKLAPRRADLEKEAAMIYAKAFSEEELKQIAAFYNSDAGKKLLKDGPISIRELSKAGDIWATGVSRDMAKAINIEVKDKINAQLKAEGKVK